MNSLASFLLWLNKETILVKEGVFGSHFLMTESAVSTVSSIIDSVKFWFRGEAGKEVNDEGDEGRDLGEEEEKKENFVFLAIEEEALYSLLP